MMSAHLRILVLLAAVCLSPAPLIAQNTGALPGTGMSNFDLNRLMQNHWILAGKVTTLRGDPIRGAKVDVEPLSALGWIPKPHDRPARGISDRVLV